MRCLWIARELPWPAISGDRIYSGQLARSLAAAGVEVRLLGLRPPDQGSGQDGEVGLAQDRLQSQRVDGGRRPPAAAMLGRLPLAAAVFDTRHYRAALRAALTEPWDMAVIDQLGSAWAIDQLAAMPESRRPLLVYVAHNHEAAVWDAMARDAEAALPKRAVLALNAWKTGRLERRVLAAADLVTAITAEDAEAFTAAGARATLVLSPGYAGLVAPERRIDHRTPRRVLMLGSFTWSIKRENLRQFLAVADPLFEARGIGFDVIGTLPESERERLQTGLRATRLHGYVSDVAPLFERARVAVVPEAIGGGFKLKFLDYLFGRLPVATLSSAAAGVPAPLRAQMIESDDLASLAADIAAVIDDTERLDRMQRLAFDQAQLGFRWEDRGRALFEALAAILPRATAAGPAQSGRVTPARTGGPDRPGSKRRAASSTSERPRETTRPPPVPLR